MMAPRETPVAFAGRLLPICALATAIAASPAMAGSAEAPVRGGVDLSGEWYFDVLSSPNGPGQRTALFKQEGERVIGFIDSNAASGRFVGHFDGRQLEFTAVLEFGGQPMAAEYRAMVDGDTMTGQIDYGLYGQATFVAHRGRRPDAKSPGEPGAGIVGSATTAGLDAARAGDAFGRLVNGQLVPEMLPVPAGTFLMGDDDPSINPDYNADFRQVHEVRISAFRMSRFPVTNAQFLAFANATGAELPLPPRGWGDYWHRYPNNPAVNVSWQDAAAYARWLADITGEGFRLPTEAEWEYAARAGTRDRRYPWGNRWRVDAANTATWWIGREVTRDEWKAWWDGTGQRLAGSQPMTTRVGRFPPNAWGFHDLIGNVWEWTADWYQADYYAVSPASDPAGPADGEEKVLRGCSWYNQPEVCYLATRDRYAPGLRLYYNGFRVVASPQPPTR